MKALILFFLLVLCAGCAGAQNNAWFKGDWYGVRTFTGAPIGIRVLVRIEVDTVYGNRFSGRFIYMYPEDTVSRLIKTFSGTISGTAVNLAKAKETYLRNPLTRSFWSECSQCHEKAGFYLNDTNLVFKIITVNCGDSCNGETVFTKSLDTYNASVQATIKKLFNKDEANVATNFKSNQKNSVAQLGTSTLKSAGTNTDSLVQDANGKTKQVALTSTAAINATQKNKTILKDTSKNDPDVAKTNSTKTNTQTNDLAQTSTSTPKPTGINADSLPQDANGKTKQVSLIATANINATQKNKTGFPDTSKNDQALAEMNNTKTNIQTNDLAQTGTSTLKPAGTNTDSLLQDANGKSKQVALISTAGINATQKNKTILKDTSKNDQALAKTDNKKTDSISQTVSNKKLNASTATASINSSTGKDGQDAEPGKVSAMNAADTAKTVSIAPTLTTDSVLHALRIRETRLVNSFQVSSPHIQIDLFDNGEIDSDIVSVYYNGDLIVNHVVLTSHAISFNIEADSRSRHHEFILIAENEGVIPPNTALLRITSGDKLYKLNVSTSKTNNAKIAIDYVPEGNSNNEK